MYCMGFGWHPCQPASEVFKVSWWMCQYGARSPKRQKAYSNSASSSALKVGKLTKQHRQRMKLDVKTTIRTPGGGYQGSSQLKSTQSCAQRFEMRMRLVYKPCLGSVNSICSLTHLKGFTGLGKGPPTNTRPGSTRLALRRRSLR